MAGFPSTGSAGDFFRQGWDFRGFQTQIRRWRLIVRVPKSTTSARDHDVSGISDQVLEILTSIPTIGASEFLFSTTGTTAISGFSHAKAALDVEIARHVEAGAPWVFHDLRRTVASGLGRLGFPGEVIERCLNHVSGKFGGIAGVYQRHRYEDECRTALDAWGRHVSALVTEQRSNVVELRGGR